MGRSSVTITAPEDGAASAGSSKSRAGLRVVAQEWRCDADNSTHPEILWGLLRRNVMDENLDGDTTAFGTHLLPQ